MSNTVFRAEESVVATFADPSVGGRQIELTSGSVVYDQGDEASNVYFIQRGQVRLYQVGPDGAGRLLEILGPGQWFGCAAMSESHKYHAKAVVIGKTTLTQTPVAGLIEAVSRSPQAAVQLIKQLANGVQAARE